MAEPRDAHSIADAELPAHERKLLIDVTHDIEKDIQRKYPSPAE